MSFSSCDSSGSVAIWTDDTDLRIAPIFTIWAIGTLGAAFPILVHRSPARVTRIQRTTFEYVFTPRCQRFHLSQIDPGSPNMSALVSSLPQSLSTSSPLLLASSPHHVLEPHGKARCVLYPVLSFFS
jgi:hypothetical protein